MLGDNRSDALRLRFDLTVSEMGIAERHPDGNAQVSATGHQNSLTKRSSPEMRS